MSLNPHAHDSVYELFPNMMLVGCVILQVIVEVFFVMFQQEPEIKHTKKLYKEKIACMIYNRKEQLFLIPISQQFITVVCSSIFNSFLLLIIYY